MQQRGVNAGMDVEPEGRITPPQIRGRNNSKLKVLVRSHAMREEASPPREPTPTALNSPCIKLTPSADSRPASPGRVFVLSPSASSNSRGNSPSSPASTLVPSPTRRDDCEDETRKLNRQNLETSTRKCECSSHGCYICLRNQERNHNNNLSGSNNNNNTLTVGRAGTRGKLRHQGSSQGSFEGNGTPCLSRDNSSEQYTDTTGVDLELFIPETLNRNAKDRALMLRIEEELVQLAKDKAKTHFKFPPMSSYQRMLVHRCASYFGMDHNIESSGKCVVVNKTKNTRIPDVEFRQHVKEDCVFAEPEPRRSILKRDSNSVEDYNFKSPDRQCGGLDRRSKSFEEREEEYEKMHMNEEGLRWAEMGWSSTESTEYRLHTHERHTTGRPIGKLLKVQSEDVGEETTRPPCVAKSYSFGGYGGVLTRGDSLMSSHSAGPRLFTKQDSVASSVSWRLSPSSSGYKTQSQRSESVTPSPTSTPYLSGDSARQDSTNSTATNASDIHHDEAEETQVMWAVTNINSVPKGSIIINPQTGQPVMNQDGSIYHHDPDNPIPELQPPPLSSNSAAKPPPSPVKSPVKIRERPPSPKKRGVKTSTSPVVKKMNSSTSPSLPYTPPPPPPRSYSFPASQEGVAAAPPPQPPAQPFPVYAPAYPPADASGGVSVYHQPCIVFSPYNTHLPVAYDGRVESQMPEMQNYYNMTETVAGGTTQGGQSLTYQTVPTQPVWNQPMAYYQNGGSSAPRYAVPVPQQSATYLTSYPSSNYQQQTTEMISVYQQQQPVVYPNPQQPQTNVLYPNHQGVVFQQSPYYPAQTQNLPYPVNTPTPNSCASSYHAQAYDSSLVHNFTQMSIGGGKQERKPKTAAKGINSSQSSSEQNSVLPMGGYCHGQQPLYRQTPETPPASNTPSAFVGNYVAPMYFRQMSNVRASPPVTVTSRGSRSPTPASDSHIERQRYPLPPPPPPPVVYQGMPYSIQSDSRIVPGRGQPTAYRQTPIRQHQQQQQQQQQSGNHVADNKMFKSRRSRGNKPSNLPPNGKHQQQHN